MPNRYFINGGVNSNTSNTGNWSLTSGGTGGATVPGTADSAFFDANSPNATVDVALNCHDFIFTGYVNTITLTTGLTITGDGVLGTIHYITFSSTMSFSGSGNLTISGTSGEDFYNRIDVTSNTKVFPNQLIFLNSGTNPSFNLQDDMTVGSVLVSTAGIASLNLNSGTGKLRNNGSLTISSTLTAVALSGGEVVMQGTGTISNTVISGTFYLISSSITINTAGTITFSGVNGFTGGGTITYTAGTVVTTGSNVKFYNNTLNTNGITWNDILFQGNITLTSNCTINGILSITTVTISGTGQTIANIVNITGNPTFASSGGFLITNLNLNSGAVTTNLKEGVEHKVTGVFNANFGTNAARVTVKSSHATTKSIFTLSGTQGNNVYVDATRLDSSLGVTLYTFGTITDSINWNLYTIPVTISYSLAS